MHYLIIFDNIILLFTKENIKLKAFVYVFLCIVVLGAIVTVPVILLNNKTYNYADEIVCNNKSIQAKINDTLNSNCADIKIFPETTDEKPVYSSSNNSIVAVNVFDGSITCVDEGTARITVSIKNTASTLISDYFDIIVSKITYATGLEIENDFVTINSNSTDTCNMLTIIGETNIVPTITYAVNGIVLYNFSTGVLTPIGVGLETVTITIQTSETTTAQISFQVRVVDENKILTQTYNENISVGIITAFSFEVNSTGMIDAHSYNITNGESLIEVLELDYGRIIVRGLFVGTAQVVIETSTERVIFNFTITD